MFSIGRLFVTTILLVDDMRSFLDLERTFLRRSDCHILTARTGLEALKIARVENPNIILLDVEMPEMNGIEATRHLMSHPETREIPVVILSSTDRVQEALDAGAQEFIKKPVDEDTFIATVRKYTHLPVRLDPRKECEMTCSLSREGGPAFSGTVVDLSLSGLLVSGGPEIPIGTRVSLDFKLGTERILAETLVVRHVKEGFGAAFDQLSNGATMAVRAFLEEDTLS